MDKAEILKFISKHKLAVIATINKEGRPEAAVIEFCELEDFSVVIDTFRNSRKYKNIQNNKEVALVIGWDDDKTVQIEGSAVEITEPLLKGVKKKFFTKNPEAKKWGNNPEIAYVLIKPNWLRYTDLNQQPWLIKELKF